MGRTRSRKTETYQGAEKVKYAEGKSLNAVVVEALARGLDLEAGPAGHADLDHLIGTWQEDPAFDRAVADFERVDADAWP